MSLFTSSFLEVSAMSCKVKQQHYLDISKQITEQVGGQ